LVLFLVFFFCRGIPCRIYLLLSLKALVDPLFRDAPFRYPEVDSPTVKGPGDFEGQPHFSPRISLFAGIPPELTTLGNISPPGLYFLKVSPLRRFHFWMVRFPTRLSLHPPLTANSGEAVFF